jgi:hypothetical protein
MSLMFKILQFEKKLIDLISSLGLFTYIYFRVYVLANPFIININRSLTKLNFMENAIFYKFYPED